MKKQLMILLLASSMFMLAGGLFGPIYAIFVENIGGDLLTAGTAYGLFAVSAGALIFLIGKVEDKIKNQERLVILGYVLSCFGFLGYLFIKTPIHLFIVQVILGFGQAVGSPAYDGVYSKYLDKGKYASQWGTWEAMTYITAGISAIIGGFLAKIYGFRILFIVMFILSLLGLISSLFLIKKK